MAFIGGIATQRFHATILIWVCAFGGAGLTLSGVARMFPEALGFLRTPASPVQATLAAVAWVGLAIAGWLVQRRLVGAGEGAARYDFPPAGWVGTNGYRGVTAGPLGRTAALDGRASRSVTPAG